MIAFDLTPQLANEELKQFKLDYEKFFIADSIKQTIVIKAENDQASEELTEVTPLVEFLVNSTSGDELTSLREAFTSDISPKLKDLDTTDDGSLESSIF